MSNVVPNAIEAPASRGALPGEQSRAGLVIGIDLGGTKMLGAIAGPAGSILAELEVATSRESAAAQVSRLAQDLLIEVGADRARLAQIVVGVPGVVGAKGAVSLSPNVAFPPDSSFASLVSAEVGVPVFADNDANIAAFGEFSMRTDPQQSGVVLVAIGTGVGMGIVVNGAILRGAHGAAGEIGSMPFSGAVPLGQAQHYEVPVSTAGILDRYRQAGGSDRSVREIFDAADVGEEPAASVVARCLDDVAIGLGVVVALLDPGLIVLGGGIGARPGVAEQVAARLAGLVPTPCLVATSRLGTRAGVVGALALAARLAGTRESDQSSAGREVAA